MRTLNQIFDKRRCNGLVIRRRCAPAFLVSALLGACLARVGSPQGKGAPPQIPDVGMMVRNYTGNLQATNRVWFYTDTDGTELEEGGGQHSSSVEPYDELAYATLRKGARWIVLVRGAKKLKIDGVWRSMPDLVAS